MTTKTKRPRDKAAWRANRRLAVMARPSLRLGGIKLTTAEYAAGVTSPAIRKNDPATEEAIRKYLEGKHG